MKKAVLILIAAISFSIDGCSMYQKAKAPKLTTPEHFKLSVVVTNPKLNNNWWENFADYELNRLVNLALKNNYSYQISLKNIEIAQTYVTQNAANLFPQFNLNYLASRNKSITNGLTSTTNQRNVIGQQNAGTPQIFSLRQLYGSVTYEMDVWNQIGNSINQAKANVLASDADSKVIKLTLVSSVVTTYFQIAALDVNVANLHEQYRLANEIYKTINTQYLGGLIDYSIVADAKNQVALIQTNINNLNQQRQLLENTLSYLVGEYPENFHVKINHTLNHLEFDNLIPEGIPANMIANRPDIQEAYFQVLANGYAEKQSLANFLPTFNITGDYGNSKISLANMAATGGSSIFWNLGINILQPLIDFGARKSIYDRSKLQYEASVLNYKNTVINAYKEVDSAMSAYEEDRQALRALTNVKNNTEEKFNLASAQYQSGLYDYPTYLPYELNYLQSRYNLTNQQLNVTLDVIQIYKTLGLGLGTVQVSKTLS